jgi:hypothetical protein
MMNVAEHSDGPVHTGVARDRRALTVTFTGCGVSVLGTSKASLPSAICSSCVCESKP